MIKLFINADDFGLSNSVNRAIVECFNNKFISGTTLMVNMPFCDEAVQFSRHYDFFDCVGLHLNVSQGVPLSNEIKNIPLFVGNDGMFNDGFRRKYKKMFLLSRNEKRALTKEFEMQIEKYLSFGYGSTHLDSHRHSHTCWSFFDVLVPLLKRYKFATTRLNRNINQKIRPHKKLHKYIFNCFLKSKTSVLTKYFTSFDCILKQGFPQNGVLELMCHPNFSSDGALMNTGSAGFEELFKNLETYELLKPAELGGK